MNKRTSTGSGLPTWFLMPAAHRPWGAFIWPSLLLALLLLPLLCLHFVVIDYFIRFSLISGSRFEYVPVVFLPTGHLPSFFSLEIQIDSSSSPFSLLTPQVLCCKCPFLSVQLLLSLSMYKIGATGAPHNCCTFLWEFTCPWCIVNDLPSSSSTLGELSPSIKLPAIWKIIPWINFISLISERIYDAVEAINWSMDECLLVELACRSSRLRLLLRSFFLFSTSCSS